MSTIKKITKQDFVNLIAAGNRVEEISLALNIPKSKVREGMNIFGLKFPRASKGGTIIQWADETEDLTETTVEVTPVAEVKVVEDTLAF